MRRKTDGTRLMCRRDTLLQKTLQRRLFRKNNIPPKNNDSFHVLPEKWRIKGVA